MEPALKLSALAQPFDVGDAEKLNASAFSDIAQSQEILKRQLQLITSSSCNLFQHTVADIVLTCQPSFGPIFITILLHT